MNTEYHTCYVCGYDKLEDAPEDWGLCPSCGTQFGYSDSIRSYDQLRQNWIASGAEWAMPWIPKPLNWNPVAQLLNIGYTVTSHDLMKIVQGGAIEERA